MVEPMEAKEFTFTNVKDDGSVAEVTFRVAQLLPREAKRMIIHDLRPLFGGSTRMQGAAAEGWQAVVATITEAPAEKYDAIMARLYRSIQYSTPQEPHFKPLAGDEDRAFMDLDAGHILALEGRAFYLNFFRSWGVLLSEFPFLRGVFDRLNQRMSTPSSGTPSAPGLSTPPNSTSENQTGNPSIP